METRAEYADRSWLSRVTKWQDCEFVSTFLAVLPGTFRYTKVEITFQLDGVRARGVSGHLNAAHHPLSWLFPNFIEFKRTLSFEAHVKSFKGH